MKSILRKWKLWLAGVIAAIAFAAFGVPYVYANFIAGEAPAPLVLSTTDTSPPSETSGSSDVSAEGTWTVGDGSQAGYRVKEVLNGQSVEAVGRTDDVTGTLTLSASAVESGSFTVDLTSVTSDSSMRDTQFNGRIMDTATYPTATLELSGPIQFESIPTVGSRLTATATGELTLHGVTKQISFEVTVARTGAESFDVATTIPVTFADYGIDNPSFAPMVTTEDDGVIEVLLHFTR